MGSLLATMSIAVSALEAQQAGLQTTTNNLANLSTAGYSRERPVLEEAAPEIQNGIAYGMGVQLTGIQSLRDPLLDLQIGNEIQQKSQAQSYVNTMNQVQTLFPDDTSGIGQQITAFFNSLNSLSTNPPDSSLRQSVLSSAGSMASAFNNVADQLTSTRSNIDQNVQQDTGEINQLTQQIASVNSTLSTTAGSVQDYGSLLDERNSLVQQLSGLIDVSVVNDGASLTLTTRQGTALVVGGQSFALSTSLDPTTATQHIFSQGKDITATISGGQLGGLLQARDQAIPTLQTQLDTLASGLTQNLNAANHMGFDLQGDPGGDLFGGGSGLGAAASIKVAITDPGLLAASSDGTAGSNGNIANLSAVANQNICNGMTPTETYANLVFQVGNTVSQSTAELDASTTVLQQLQQQDSTTSGVSLDEEASNLLLYQRAYEAAARAISTVDQMLQTAINMGANG